MHSRFLSNKIKKPSFSLRLISGFLAVAATGTTLAAPAYVNQPPTARFNITPSTTPIAAGTTGNQTITVTNVGPSTATNVVITYTPPTTSGITVNSVTSAAGACTVTGSSWVCPAITSMALNATTTITVNMSVASSVPAGTTAGSNTAVNSNEFNPGNGTGESLFNIWGAYGTSAKAGDAFWFGFDGYYETFDRRFQYYEGSNIPYLPMRSNTTPGPAEEGGSIAALWPTSQANPPGGYNLINDTTTSFKYSRPITSGGDGSNPPGASWLLFRRNGATYGSANYYGYSGLDKSSNVQGFQYPYGTTSTKTTDNRPTYSQITNAPITMALAEDQQVNWIARDNRRAWEVKTGIYLNSPSPIYLCIGNVDDGMYAAIDGTSVVEQTAWNGGVTNSSGLNPATGGNYAAGYHEITYRIVNRNNQFRSFESGPGGFGFLGVGTKSTSDCTQQNYSTLTRVAPASDAVISAPALTVVKLVDSSYVTVTPDPANTGTAALPASQLSPAQLKYTITVTNTGTAAASAVNVTDTLPTGLTFVSATLAKSTAANTYGTPADIANSGTGQNLSFNVGDLTAVEPGKSAQIVVTANANLLANTVQTALLNTAAAGATGLTPINSNQVRTDIVYPKLTKRVRNVTQNKPVDPTTGAPTYNTSGTGNPNDILEYCLDYHNYGSTSLTNWKLEDAIPANTTYSGISTPMPGLTYDGSKVVYGPLTLAPGATGSVCFQVRIGTTILPPK